MAKHDETVAPPEPQLDSSRVSRAKTPQAQRALDEAELRRRTHASQASDMPHEVNGRGGPEPVRYGDWENRGIATDF